MFKNTKKRKAAVLFLGLAALMVPSTTLMAQYDGNGGLFGLGNKAESGVQRDGGPLGSPLGIGTLQELGDGLQVSWTALCETDIVQLTVLNVEVDLLGAYSHWDIRIMCHIA